ncbi:MAG: LacI family DNA-binding transcriptional regulator [Anaerolineales bacterium]|nr:LacI family DNA-binding transcriptional regulator [Anaerolineales bacterium]
MTKTKKIPTMKDVAKLSGVSQTTVSLIINKAPKANISEKTNQAVRKAIKQLGYRPNVIAQNLRTRQSHVIGLITDEVSVTPFAGEMILGVLDALRESGKLLMMMDSGGEEKNEIKQIDVLLSRQIEGIIYATMRHKVIRAPDLLQEIPCVLLNCQDTGKLFSSLIPDDFMGGVTATEELIKRGYSCVGMINTTEHVPATELREQGFRKALSDHGKPFEADRIYYGEDGNAKTGYDGAKQLLAIHPEMDALFCFNDRVAMGAYDAARQMNKKIPQQLAIIGFDDFTLISESVHPPLTTMKLPHYEMGMKAGRQLVKMIKQPRWKPASRILKLPIPLVLRESI